MTCNCCSGNFSSCSFRHGLPSSGSSCGSSCPSNLVYTTTSCSPSACQLGSPLHSGCQETCIEPTSCQRSCVVSSPCKMTCYYPRSSMSCSPCEGTYAGSVCFGSSNFHSQDYGSRRFYIVGCGPSGVQSLNYTVCGFPFQSYVSRFSYPTYLDVNNYQPCYKPTCGNILYAFCY